MTDDSENRREQGVEFGPLGEELEAKSYPVTAEELLEEHGDSTIELEDGSMTLSEVLQIENERTFEDSEAVRQAIIAMVDSEAVGRDEYSDRGGTTPDENDTEDTESL